MIFKSYLITSIKLPKAKIIFFGVQNNILLSIILSTMVGSTKPLREHDSNLVEFLIIKIPFTYNVLEIFLFLS